MARLKQIVVDAHHPPALARFWSEALDGFSIRPYDDEVARLVSLGATVREGFEHRTWLRDPEGNDFCITDAEVSR